jgi:hypothetical protein
MLGVIEDSPLILVPFIVVFVVVIFAFSWDFHARGMFQSRQCASGKVSRKKGHICFGS